MCFDTDSRPPIAPRAPMAGAAVDHQDLELVAADGNRLRAFAATADRDGAADRAARPPGILILPDVRGLYPFYEELALRFAEAGVDALVIDYFGRTFGTDKRDDAFEYMPHVDQTTWTGLRADIGAGSAWLRESGVTQLFSVGFCFGGRLSFLLASDRELALTGVIGFYGTLTGSKFNLPAPVETGRDAACPVLGLFGGDDAAIPSESIDAFDASLTAAGVEHEMIIYPGAPHSFFDRKRADFAAESTDAWDRTLSFIGENAAES